VIINSSKLKTGVKFLSSKLEKKGATQRKRLYVVLPSLRRCLFPSKVFLFTDNTREEVAIS